MDRRAYRFRPRLGRQDACLLRPDAGLLDEPKEVVERVGGLDGFEDCRPCLRSMTAETSMYSWSTAQLKVRFTALIASCGGP